MTARFEVVIAVLVALLLVIGGAVATPSVGAQQPTVKSIGNGFQIEEVRVGDSCVVVVSSGGPGQPVVSATPCAPW